ncbi:hypothetical protein T479_09360 [Lysinibacillus varians]|nr:hypothetical protein T479_09360 [Lysinibacillus varians]
MYVMLEEKWMQKNEAFDGSCIVEYLALCMFTLILINI